MPWFCVAAPLALAGDATPAPVTLFSRQFGGSDGDFPTAITVDAQGFTYIAGYTYSTNFPDAPVRTVALNDSDIFITKLNPAGAIVYSLTLGGSSHEQPAAIAVDARGDIYLAGRTASTNFPTVNAFQSAPTAASMVFLLKLDGANLNLIYSTYFGGQSFQQAAALAVTTNGEAVVLGSTGSSDFPTTPGAFQAELRPGSGDAFIAKFGPQGTNLIFSTLLGGSEFDSPAAMALDDANNIFIAGATASADFPVTPNAYQTALTASEYRSEDVFVTKLSANGQTLVYSTFWGTTESDRAYSIAVDSAGAAYVAGGDLTRAFGQPSAPGGVRPPPTVQPIRDSGFLLRLAPSGAQLDYARQFHTTGHDSVRALSLDAQGALHLAGYFGNQIFHGIIANPAVDPGANFSAFLSFAACENTPYTEMAFAPSGALHRVGSPGPSGIRAPGVSSAQLFERRREAQILAQAWAAPSSAHYPPVAGLSLLDLETDRFSVNESIYLRLDAGDLHGLLSSVSVQLGGNTIATFTNAPQLITLTNLAPGAYLLLATASDSAGLCATSCPVHFTVVAPPANDSFYHSIQITGTSYLVQASTAGASLESAEPVRDPYYPNTRRSLWWCWTAPVSGTFAVRPSSDEIIIDLGIYVGDELSQLQRVAFASPGAHTTGSAKCAFKAVAGVTYFFSIHSVYSGAFTLQFLPANPPSNDDYANRIVLSGVDFTIDASNLDATHEPAVPRDSVTSPSSVWYRWSAPADGVFLMSVAGTNFYPILDVYNVTNSGLSLPNNFRQRWAVTAQAGQQFDLRVSGSSGGMGSFSLSISNLAVPANDNFASAAPISGFPVTVGGSTFGASSEPFEPGSSPTSSVWYRWIAPSNTTATLEIQPGYGAALGVYTGTALSNLIEVASDLSVPTLTFPAQAGVEYYFVVDVYYDEGGEFQLMLRPARSATNDNFADATPISGDIVSVLGSNREATREFFEPQHLQFTTGEESVWWRWTAPASSEYHLSVDPALVSLAIAAYTGTALTNLVPATVPASVPATGFATRLSATAGVEYHLAVSGYSGSGNSFRLRIRPALPPVNDHFANRIALSGTAVQTGGSNIDASAEPGEPIEFSQTGASVWWSWTASASGKVAVWLTNASDRLRLQVFTGGNISALTSVAQVYSGVQGLGFDAAAGQVYAISVDGNYGYRGSFSLALAPLVPPVNDHFTNALPLAGISAVAFGTGAGSSREPGEPPHLYSSAGSVWWTWIAPASGRTTINVSDSGFSPATVYTGDSVNALTVVPDAARSFGNSATFIARAGVAYRMAVYSQSVFPFQLTLTAPASPPNPRLDSVRALPDGAFEFSFEVVPGRTNIVEASTDLSIWTPIATNVLDCGFLILSDSAATNFTHRFYRVRTP